MKLRKVNKQRVLLDSSGIIDPRLLRLCQSGFVDWRVLVTSYVLEEVQMLADTGSKLKRDRARAGLEMLSTIKTLEHIEFELIRTRPRDDIEVDQRLINDSERLEAKLYTIDFNLDRIARVHGIDVLNVNQLMLDMRIEYQAGDTTEVKVVQPGSEKGQGVAFSDDGTMIVITDAAKYIGKDVKIIFDNMLQTESGRILFAKVSAQPKKQEKGKAAESQPNPAKKVNSEKKPRKRQQPQHRKQPTTKSKPTNNRVQSKPLNQPKRPPSKRQIEAKLIDQIEKQG